MNKHIITSRLKRASTQENMPCYVHATWKYLAVVMGIIRIKTSEVWVQGSAIRVHKLHNLEAKKVTKIQGNFKCCQYFLQQTLISRKLKNIKRMNKNTVITN